MENDFKLITRYFDSHEDIEIYPISDVHLGAAEHMQKEWKKFCEDIVNKPNAYIILAGDLINNATRSSVSNVYEDVLRPREQKRIMTEMLTPLRDKILCAVSGNHERRSIKDVDDDPTYDIMCKLDLEDLYRENMAFVKVHFGPRKDRGRYNPTYVFAVSHGAGGGMTGAAVNRGEKFGYVIDGMDCLIVGHTHKPFTTQPIKIKIDAYNNTVSFKPFKVVCSTSWLNYGGYAASKMMTPASHCPQIITICGDHKEMKVTM